MRSWLHRNLFDLLMAFKYVKLTLKSMLMWYMPHTGCMLIDISNQAEKRQENFPLEGNPAEPPLPSVLATRGPIIAQSWRKSVTHSLCRCVPNLKALYIFLRNAEKISLTYFQLWSKSKCPDCDETRTRCVALRPRDRPARRDNTLGSWCQQYTHSWLIL